MGLFDKLRGELIDIIEWIDDSNHTLVWRFPRFNNEIKNGARLIVRPTASSVERCATCAHHKASSSTQESVDSPCRHASWSEVTGVGSTGVDGGFRTHSIV